MVVKSGEERNSSTDYVSPIICWTKPEENQVNYFLILLSEKRLRTHFPWLLKDFQAPLDIGLISSPCHNLSVVGAFDSRERVSF